MYRSIAPASISSPTPSISGLASDRWCEKGSQPIDSHFPDQATGVPLNSSTSMELNAGMLLLNLHLLCLHPEH